MPPRRTLDYEEAIRRVIRQIPRGKVATYGQVAAEAGFPGYHRQVVQVLRRAHGSLPWQRVLGAGGLIKVPPAEVHEQRLLLEMEGVRFRGRRVDMEAHQWEGLPGRPVKGRETAPKSAKKPATVQAKEP